MKKSAKILILIIAGGLLFNCSYQSADSSKARTSLIASFVTGNNPFSRIFFSTNLDGNHDIYSVKLDGTSLKKHNNSSTDDFSPFVSNNGNRVYFTSGTATKTINYVDSGSLTETIFVSSASHEQDISISTDETKIMFQSNRDGNQEIYTANIDATNQTRITSNATSDQPGAWSNDGSTIFYWHIDGGGDREIYRMSSTGVSVTQITTNTVEDAGQRGGSLSPDGTKIVYFSQTSGKREIYTMNIDGSGITQLTTTSGGANRCEQPVFTQDGSQIVYLCDIQNTGTLNLYIMNSDGSTQTLISEHPTFFDSNPFVSKPVFYE